MHACCRFDKPVVSISGEVWYFIDLIHLPLDEFLNWLHFNTNCETRSVANV